MPRGSKAPAPSEARLRRTGKRRKLTGPFEAVILRFGRYARPDLLDFTVEVRPVGSRGNNDHVVARFRDIDDAKAYGALKARKFKCQLLDYAPSERKET